MVTLKILLNSYILPGKLASMQSQSALLKCRDGSSIGQELETSLGKILNPVSNKTKPPKDCCVVMKLGTEPRACHISSHWDTFTALF